MGATVYENRYLKPSAHNKFILTGINKEESEHAILTFSAPDIED